MIVSTLILTQFALVYAAPSQEETGSITGSIYEINVVTDTNTDVTTVLITLIDDQNVYHTVRVSEETAYITLGLIYYDEDGNPQPIEADYWPESVTIEQSDILPEQEETHHPVGNALAAFFSGIDGVDYDVIMTAHEDGYGFGVIAQALWLTQKLEGNSDDLLAILDAKKSGDFSTVSYLLPGDSTIPTNWGQFRKTVMAGDKKENLGAVMSNKDKSTGNPGGDNTDHGNAGNGNSNQDKNKDKSNNGNNGNKDNNGKNNKP